MERLLEEFQRMAEAQARIAAAMERLAANWDVKETHPDVPRKGKDSKCMQAMRLLAEMGPDNLAEIAKAVGVNRGTLYRWPVFMEAVERQRAAEQWVPRAPRARAVPHDEL